MRRVIDLWVSAFQKFARQRDAPQIVILVMTDENCLRVLAQASQFSQRISYWPHANEIGIFFLNSFIK